MVSFAVAQGTAVFRYLSLPSVIAVRSDVAVCPRWYAANAFCVQMRQEPDARDQDVNANAVPGVDQRQQLIGSDLVVVCLCVVLGCCFHALDGDSGG